ncbi:MAG TPA: hypothetical protein ACFE0H_10390 [Elainellaceae cyanobacterium]
MADAPLTIVSKFAYALSGLTRTRDVQNMPKLLSNMSKFPQKQRQQILFRTLEQLSSTEQVFLKDQIARFANQG